MNTYSLPFKVSLLAVAVTLTACGGSSKSSSGGAGLANNGKGEFTISAQGGSSATAQAGQGGNLYAVKTSSATKLAIQERGTPNAKYKLPTYELNFGTEKLTVDTDTEIQVVTDSEGLAAGDYYQRQNNGNYIFKFVDEDTFGHESTRVTGIEILAGATLSLNRSNMYSNEASLSLANALVNNGSITTIVPTESVPLAPGPSMTGKPSLYINAAVYQADGTVDTSGTDNGANAGSVRITANIIVNKGAITANGADYVAEEGGEGSSNAGNGASIRLSAAKFIENTAALSAVGGGAAESTSGQSGEIDLSSDAVYNTGTITFGAKSSERVYAGSYKSSEIYARRALINTGDISFEAGSAEEGNGAYGGDVSLYLLGSTAEDRKIINTGNIDLTGGDTAAEGSLAGRGGDLEVIVFEGAEGELFGGYGGPYSAAMGGPGGPGFSFYGGPVVDAAPAQVAISGNVTLDGGDATLETEGAEGNATSRGGSAGSLYLAHYADKVSTFDTFLAGYQSVNLSGGNGVAPGDAGEMNVEAAENIHLTSDGDYEYGFNRTPKFTPEIEVTTNLVLNAGQQTKSTTQSEQWYHQADAGHIQMAVMAHNDELQKNGMGITIKGDISLAGFDVINAEGAEGGTVSLYATKDIVVQGNINANSGDVTIQGDPSDTTRDADNGGYITLVSAESTVNYKGDITANGGSSKEDPGMGGSVFIMGAGNVSVSGTITANGGSAENATGDDSKTEGADGGTVVVMNDNYNAKLGSTVSVAAGTGDINGLPGTVAENTNCEGSRCNQAGGPIGPR